MKKLILMVMAIVGMAVSVEAQTFLGGIQVSHAKAHAIVHMKNGQEIEYTRLNLPANYETRITASNDDKKKETIQSEDIEYIEAWNDNTPDRHYIFQYCPCNFPSYKTVWCVLVAIGDHLYAYRSSQTYCIEKNGTLTMYRNEFSSIALIYYKKEANEWLTMPGVNKKTYKEFFKDDPKIYEMIDSKKINIFSDFEYIVENYNPKK